MNMKFKIRQRGQSLVEIIIAMGLSVIILPALLTGLISSREGKAQQAQRTQAVYLLNRTVDAVRSVREKGWANIASLTTGVPYHPEISGQSWSLIAGEDINLTTGLNTKVIMNNVNRGTCPGTDCEKIVTTGGNLDPSTKKVEVTISWSTPYASSIQDTLYLTRYLDNDAFKQTLGLRPTPADFDLGTKANTDIVASLPLLTPTPYDAQVQLGVGGGGGDWCKPSLSVTSVDLSRQGVPTSVWAFESGNGTGNRVLAGTGQNASGPTFTDTKITGNSPNITATALGQFNNTKANAVFGNSNYAYLATDNNSQEIIILDLNQFSDPPTNSLYKEVGWFDSESPTDANSVAVSGNTGFMTAGNKFYAFNLQTLIGTSSQPQLGSTITLDGTGVKIFVVGNYAYVVISGSTTKMQIIDVGNPSNLSDSSKKGKITSSQIDSGDGRDVYVNSTGTRAYLATAGSATQKEFFIIDVSNKSNPVPVSGGSYDTNGMDPKGVTVVTGNRAIIVGTGGTKQYQVIDLSTNPPSACGTNGSLAVTGGVYAVSSLLQTDGYAYSYIVTGDTHNELKIILGGAGAGNGSTYTSDDYY